MGALALYKHISNHVFCPTLFIVFDFTPPCEYVGAQFHFNWEMQEPSLSLISETPLIDRAIRGMELARDEADADFDGDDFSDDETSLISNCSQRCGLGSS